MNEESCIICGKSTIGVARLVSDFVVSVACEFNSSIGTPSDYEEYLQDSRNQVPMCEDCQRLKMRHYSNLSLQMSPFVNSEQVEGFNQILPKFRPALCAYESFQWSCGNVQMITPHGVKYVKV